jgi:hypothetical protein
MLRSRTIPDVLRVVVHLSASGGGSEVHDYSDPEQHGSNPREAESDQADGHPSDRFPE